MLKRRSNYRNLAIESLEPRTVLSAQGFPLSEMVVFGDSLSDTGNTLLSTGGTIPTSPPYFAGRFSNGPVWVEALADDLNIPDPTPGVAGGTNFAFGSARSGDGISPVGTPNIGTQIDTFLDLGGTLDGDELVVVWGGANNFFDLFFSDDPPEVPEIVTDVITDISTHVQTLAGAGGKYFLVPNVVPLGSTPAVQGIAPELAPLLNGAIDQLNAGLEAQLAGLEAALAGQGVEIVTFDVNGLVDDVVADPDSFGFSNATLPVLPGGGFGSETVVDDTLLGDPDDFLFWDLVHPTAKAHQMIGEYAADAVFAELEVEALQVDSAADVVENNDGLTTLREAVELANRLPGAQQIGFDAIGPQIDLTQGQLDIADDAHVRGSGANLLTISGGGQSRVFHVGAGVDATISHLTIADGFAEQGGGIHNEGSLTLHRARLVNNTAQGEQAMGGAIFNDAGAHLRVNFSQLTGNHAEGGSLGAGGAIASVGEGAETRLFGTSVIGNTATGADYGLGGGIFVGDGASLVSRFSLIAGNQANSSDDGEGIGGGIFVDAESSASIARNLIFANLASTWDDNISW